MTVRRGWWALGAAGLVALGALLLRPARDALTTAAPRFVAQTIDSVPVTRTLDDYAGHPVLLNVWATWCDPCREEMPGFERLHRAYRDRGLRVVAISVDNADQGAIIREFVAELGLTFDVLHDGASAILQQYAVRGVPQTFLISRSGQLMGTRFVADWDSPAFRALTDTLLASR